MAKKDVERKTDAALATLQSDRKVETARGLASAIDHAESERARVDREIDRAASKFATQLATLLERDTRATNDAETADEAARQAGWTRKQLRDAGLATPKSYTASSLAATARKAVTADKVNQSPQHNNGDPDPAEHGTAATTD